jgi:hypothetical protein
MSDPQFTAHQIYGISCECDRIYVGETGRLLSVRIREHEENLKNGLLGKSKLAQHLFEEDQVFWNEAKILHIGFFVGVSFIATCVFRLQLFMFVCV